MESRAIAIVVDNIRLEGKLYIPRHSNVPYPAICICHGLPAGPYNPSESHYPVVAEKCCRAGYVTLIFNFRGAGLSGGDFDLNGWKRDLHAAVDLISGLNEVDNTKLVVMGFSAGAAVGICTAAVDKRIACVAAMACPADFSTMKRERAQESITHFRNIGIIRNPDFPESIDSWFNGFQELNAIECIADIAPRPLLLVHGRKDDVVSLEHAERLSKKAGAFTTLYILENAGHRLSRDDEAINIALDWIRNKLHIDRDSTKDL